MHETLLEVKNLEISFETYVGEVQAVRGVNFDLRRGETLAIVGESGSGKSVSTQAILGLLHPKNTRIKQGEILYLGQDLLTVTDKDMQKIRGQEIAAIFPDPEGPMMAIYSPFFMEKFTSWSTGTWLPPCP